LIGTGQVLLKEPPAQLPNRKLGYVDALTAA
jgi:hypothetical protein